MLPFGIHDVTVIHRKERKNEAGKTVTEYSRYIYHNCTWSAVVKESKGSDNACRWTEILCRVPASEASGKIPATGDYMVHGVVKECPQTVNELAELLDRHRAKGTVRITAVDDNANIGYPLPHIKITGE